ncbi:MAG TPA: hypothetical protein PKD52_03425 [Clostridiales bacterium]|nr:hypothetical protein [Clostridiales bacterium]
MKKLFLLPVLFLMLLLTSCQFTDNSTYTGDLKLNIQHINESDNDKNIDISYPVFGGIENKEAITIINSSISNYVTAEYDEFQNALTTKNQSVITDAATNGSGDSSDSNDSDDSDDSDISDDSDNSGASGDDTAANGSGTANTGSTGEPIRLTMSFKITYNKNDYLCVVQTYEKELGQNKTFTGQRSFLFSLKNAAYLSLGEVFDFDSGFPAYINKGIEAELDKGAYNTYDRDNGFTGISKDCNFYIDHNYLYIYYNALEISPDMDIVPTFAFKIKDLKEYFNDDFTNIF